MSHYRIFLPLLPALILFCEDIFGYPPEMFSKADVSFLVEESKTGETKGNIILKIGTEKYKEQKLDLSTIRYGGVDLIDYSLNSDTKASVLLKPNKYEVKLKYKNRTEIGLTLDDKKNVMIQRILGASEDFGLGIATDKGIVNKATANIGSILVSSSLFFNQSCFSAKNGLMSVKRFKNNSFFRLAERKISYCDYLNWGITDYRKEGMTIHDVNSIEKYRSYIKDREKIKHLPNEAKKDPSNTKNNRKNCGIEILGNTFLSGQAVDYSVSDGGMSYSYSTSIDTDSPSRIDVDGEDSEFKILGNLENSTSVTNLTVKKGGRATIENLSSPMLVEIDDSDESQIYIANRETQNDEIKVVINGKDQQTVRRGEGIKIEENGKTEKIILQTQNENVTFEQRLKDILNRKQLENKGESFLFLNQLFYTEKEAKNSPFLKTNNSSFSTFSTNLFGYPVEFYIIGTSGDGTNNCGFNASVTDPKYFNNGTSRSYFVEKLKRAIENVGTHGLKADQISLRVANMLFQQAYMHPLANGDTYQTASYFDYSLETKIKELESQQAQCITDLAMYFFEHDPIFKKLLFSVKDKNTRDKKNLKQWEQTLWEREVCRDNILFFMTKERVQKYARHLHSPDRTALSYVEQIDNLKKQINDVWLKIMQQSTSQKALNGTMLYLSKFENSSEPMPIESNVRGEHLVSGFFESLAILQRASIVVFSGTGSIATMFFNPEAKEIIFVKHNGGFHYEKLVLKKVTKNSTEP